MGSLSLNASSAGFSVWDYSLWGYFSAGTALFIVLDAFPGLVRFMGLRLVPMGDKSISVVYLPFAVLTLFLGVKFIAKAIAPRRQKPLVARSRRLPCYPGAFYTREYFQRGAGLATGVEATPMYLSAPP